MSRTYIQFLKEDQLLEDMARLPWDTAPLPCCGIGVGWLLFILGFFLGVIPWYVGAIMLLCVKDYDKREKPGFIACAIVAVMATIAIIVAVAIVYHN
ncbi:hypothetical protein RHSIM_Rhsim06G0186800 [Rhododendron simsii]|uniref:60S ribosomal protein L18a-like protein n=1 Tax=Rhododendron simsii TaxID=118357 RepID=A0A834LNF2_RHOSS|nr:hypothetical protein RHSIM_Rhsim06G0186800 [Rhododendron simsii]